MRLMDRISERLAGLSPAKAAFDTLPEPRITGSARRGRDILQGKLLLGGHFMQIAPGAALFTAAAPESFLREAHGFGWLADLAALGDTAARDLARRWLDDWLGLYGRGRGPGWDVQLTGRRVTHLIDNAMFLMAGRGPAEEAAFCRALAKQIRLLERRWSKAPPGLPRIEALLGLIRAGQALASHPHLLGPAARDIAKEAERLIDKEGGIASRNPEELMEVFARLTRAAQLLSEADHAPERGHIAAMERAAPVLRALRHADGSLARFHGGDQGAEGRLDQALAASGIRGGAASGLAMGFCRLSHGRSSLILDAAAPPIGPASRLAQASTLGFELTSGRRPLIVNCGPGQTFGPDWHQAARATASASTLEIIDFSSSRLGVDRQGRIADVFAETPGDVREQRTSDETGTEVVASHDGYVTSHGLTHMRRLSLSADGRAVLGEDTLAAVRADHQRLFDAALAEAGGEIAFALRFHLHPEVEVQPDPSGGAVLLRLRSGEVWQFRHDGQARLSIEASAWLSQVSLKPLASKQVVLSAAAIDYASRVRWSLAKAPDAPSATRDLLRDEIAWTEHS